MGICYQGQTDPDNYLNLNYSGVDLISWIFAALHLPVNRNVVCPEAAPRISYQALEADTLKWAEILERALEENDPALRECFNEYKHLFDGEFVEFQAWLGDWVVFFRTCGGYTSD